MNPLKILRPMLSSVALFSLLLISACEIDLDGMWDAPTYSGPTGGYVSPTYECSPTNICLDPTMSEEQILALISEATEGDTIVFNGSYFFLASGIDLRNKKNIVINGINSQVDFNLPDSAAFRMDNSEGVVINGLSVSGKISHGFLIKNSRDIILESVTIHDIPTGVDVQHSENIVLWHTSVYSTRLGGRFTDCTNCEVAACTFDLSWTGLEIINPRQFEVVGTDFNSNTNGIIIRNKSGFEGQNELLIGGINVYGNNGTDHSQIAPESARQMSGVGLMLAGIVGARLEDSYFDANCQAAVAVFNHHIFDAPENMELPTDGYSEGIELHNNYFNISDFCTGLGTLTLQGKKIPGEIDVLTDGLFNPQRSLTESLCLDETDIRFLNLHLGSEEDPTENSGEFSCE